MLISHNLRQRRVLRNYQKDALRYCMRVPNPALFMEMRLGKTIVAIRAVKFREYTNILVVAPYSALPGWKSELMLEGCTSIQFEGSRKERLQQFTEFKKNPHFWVLVNKEIWQTLPEISSYPWDCIILDESPCIKSATTSISKFFITNFRDCRARFILTGTPAPESELDYFQQLKFLDSDILNEKNFWEFRFKNFGSINHRFYLSPYGSSYLSERLASYTFILTRHDVSMSGRKIYERRFIRQSPKSLESYRRICKEFLLTLDGEIVGSTIYSITQYQYLRRLCGGFVDGQFVFPEKMQELIYLLKGELSRQPIIIWANYTDEIHKINEWIIDEGQSSSAITGEIPPAARAEIVDLFQRGIYQRLVLQPKCMQFGLDLSHASTMIYYSTPESLNVRLQSEDRLINVATGLSCLIVDLVMFDTIEESILDSLAAKEGRQELMRRVVRKAQHVVQS